LSRLTHRTMPGFTYFVTTKTWQNRAIFQVNENAELLVRCMIEYRNQGAFSLHEFVVMPNHLHLLLTPNGETSLEKAIQLIKGGSSYQIHRIRESKIKIWNSGFHEATVRNSTDFEIRREYIRMNPVKKRLVQRPELWEHSSASGHFELDVRPERLSSGAEAPSVRARNVGAKAPTP
jgi:putative transposase